MVVFLCHNASFCTVSSRVFCGCCSCRLQVRGIQSTNPPVTVFGHHVLQFLGRTAVSFNLLLSQSSPHNSAPRIAVVKSPTLVPHSFTEVGSGLCGIGREAQQQIGLEHEAVRSLSRSHQSILGVPEPSHKNLISSKTKSSLCLFS